MSGVTAYFLRTCTSPAAACPVEARQTCARSITGTAPSAPSWIEVDIRSN